MDITHICRRADCLFALDALGGGRYLAPLSTLAPPATPRASNIWAERAGVITCSNIRSGDDGFYLINRAAAGGIATQLDFRGNKTSKTFIVRTRLVKPPYTSQTFLGHTFISQGYAMGANAACIVWFGILTSHPTGGAESHLLKIVFGGPTLSSGVCPAPAAAFDGKPHTFAATVDYTRGLFALFFDGKCHGRWLFDVTLAFPTTSTDACVSIRKTHLLTAETESTISHAMIFEGALSDAKIVAICQVL